MAKDAEHADAVAKAQALLEAHKLQVAAEKADAEAKAAKLQAEEDAKKAALDAEIELQRIAAEEARAKLAAL